ncbi:signal peptidase I [Natrialbaceae archaeon A-gly3]
MRRVLALVAIGGLLVVLLPVGPIQLSYVYSDSMEPTIGEGDGYVVVPAGEVDRGDIVVFDSEYRGEYVTHRVVDVTEMGYVTQGDNNPSTDQAGGHPPVTDEDIVGSVLTIGDSLVVIPRLAVLTGVIATYWPLGVLAVFLGASALERNPRSRDVVRVDDLVRPLVLTAVIGCAVAVVYSAPTYSMSLVAVASDSTAGRTIPIGESVTRTIDVTPGPPFTYQFVDGAGVTVVETISEGEQDTVEVLVPAQEAAGGYAASVTTYYYPAVLPYGITGALHGFHPLAASLASIGTIITPVYAVHWFLVDGRALLTTRSRSRTAWWEFR